MSKYRKYVTQIDDKAKETFREYTRANEQYKQAEKRCKEYPPRTGLVTADYSANCLRAQADFEDAKLELRRAKEKLSALSQSTKLIRAELVAELERDNIVNPDEVDNSTIELLKSGILTPSDYSALLNRHSSNSTMTRLISKAINDRAKEETEPRKRAELQVLVSNTRTEVSDRLANFDTLAYTLERTANNPAMISHWDSLTSGIVENF